MLAQLAQLILLFVSTRTLHGLRAASSGAPEEKRFRMLRSPEMVPHCMVDDHHRRASGEKDASACLEHCKKEPLCTGIQITGVGSCVFRWMHVMAGPNASCVQNYRALMTDRGFGDVPMVALAESDGTIYMREDCLDQDVRIHGNTYWGLPWDWEQPGLGLALVRQEAYGVSPLLDLVTPSVLDDVINAGVPPWMEPSTNDSAGIVDFWCKTRADVADTIETFRSARKGKHGGALVAEVGKCICPMLANGWDPRKDLRTDVVLLLHRDVNFSPGTQFTNTARFAYLNTKMLCINKLGNTSVFKDDIEAFTVLADTPQVRGMYFLQTPPISHEKIWITPLGVDHKAYLPDLRPHLAPDSPQRRRPRAALYGISHNLAVDYRRDVVKAVQRNFGQEPLRSRYLPWATGPRLEAVVQETLQAVYGQSPIGIGENCFRHFELLLAGAIPVVQSSLGVGALRYLPHLAVSSWKEVTPSLLRSSYEKIWEQVRSGNFSFEPLTVSFWQRHILDTANGREVPAFYAKFPNPPVTCKSWKCI